MARNCSIVERGGGLGCRSDDCGRAIALPAAADGRLVTPTGGLATVPGMAFGVTTDYDFETMEREGASSIRDPSPGEVLEWEREFEAAARRPLKQRFKYAFIRTYKPVLDDVPFRAFATTLEYRTWCERNLPSWLGYGREV